MSYADTRLDVQLWFRRFVSVHLLSHMKQEAFWVTIYQATFNIANGSTTEISVKIVRSRFTAKGRFLSFNFAVTSLYKVCYIF